MKISTSPLFGQTSAQSIRVALPLMIWALASSGNVAGAEAHQHTEHALLPRHAERRRDRRHAKF